MSVAGTPTGSSALVRTVLGDIPAHELGRCDYHDHLFQASPLLPGDELDDEPASTAEAVLLRDAGIDSMIEATPTGLGRNPAAVARASLAARLHIVHVSGAHRDEHYAAGHWLLECTQDDLVQRFRADVLEGMPAHDIPERGPIAVGPHGHEVRAGMLKAGIGYWRISPFERRVLTAIAEVSRETGVAIMVHLESGSAAWEVLEVLATQGVPASRVVLAHIDRNLDPGLHAELTMAGAYLGYDGMARHRSAPDSAVLDCLEGVARTGDATRLLLGGDVARRTRYRAYDGMPGLDYLPRRFFPRVVERVGEKLLKTITVDNPARLLSITSST